MNNEEQNQLEKNTLDIREIKNDIHIIKTNHLHHIEKDMARMDKTVERMDTKVWAILILLVSSVVLAFIGDKI